MATRGRCFVLLACLMLGAPAAAVAQAHAEAAGRGGDGLFVLNDPRGTVDWKLIQRSTPDGAPMPLRLFYRLDNTGELQARLQLSATGAPLPGQGFASNRWPLAASAGQRATVTIPSVPTGGNYDVILRVVDDLSGQVVAVTRIEEVAVGDVFLAAGQSNMSGYSESLAGAEQPIDEVHLFGNDYTWKRATEPMDDGTNQVDTVSRDFPAHSSMLRFAKDIYAATGVPVAIIPGPLGGSNLVAQWQRNALTPTDRNTLYGSMLFRARIHGYAAAPVGMLWFQGESDACCDDPAYYRGLLEPLIANYRADLANPSMHWVVVQLGTYPFSFVPGWSAVQEAQRQVARADVHVALATAVDQPTWDTIHYTSEAYRTIGVRSALATLETYYGQPVNALTELVDVLPTGGDGLSVLLVYDGVVNAGEPALYALRDAAGDNVVVATSAASNVITLTLARPLVGAIAEIEYGDPLLFNRHWAVDAAGIAVPTFRIDGSDLQ